MVKFRQVIGLAVVALLVAAPARAQEDAEGCKDHPLLTRMQDFRIRSCEESEYDSHEFYDTEDNEYVIEGHKWVISYELKEGAEPPGQLMVRRNYRNAVEAIGGVALDREGRYLKLTREGSEVWIEVWASDDGSDYELTLVERTAMEQEVLADANALMSDITTAGHAAVYGIYFDFDKAEVKPESEPALREIARLLEQNPSLNLYVVGHTDNVGDVDYNLKLSEARARAVVQKLVADYSVAPERLQAYGVGPLAPQASNKTEEGRAKNRRVELVAR